MNGWFRSYLLPVAKVATETAYLTHYLSKFVGLHTTISLWQHALWNLKLHFLVFSSLWFCDIKDLEYFFKRLEKLVVKFTLIKIIPKNYLFLGGLRKRSHNFLWKKINFLISSSTRLFYFIFLVAKFCILTIFFRKSKIHMIFISFLWILFLHFMKWK